jgi:hypothetical protein
MAKAEKSPKANLATLAAAVSLPHEAAAGVKATTDVFGRKLGSVGTEAAEILEAEARKRGRPRKAVKI